MLKKISIFFILSFIIFNVGTVFATDDDKPRSLEEIFPEIGYKGVEEAVRDFEKHFERDLKVPLRVPSLDFTHHFGRFNDLEGDMNDSLEIVYLSENAAAHHYKINVYPVEHKIPFEAKIVYKLKNGSEAFYTNVSGFNLFVFERDSWQYILSIDKRVTNQVTPEVFTKIANSIGDQGEYGK